MDAFDLFKTLSTGSNFNKKRFKTDASKFRIRKEPANEVEIKIEPEEVETPGQCKRKRTETENEDPNLIEEATEVELKQETLTLLGDISVPINGSTRKKKKQKVVAEDKKIQQEKEQINHFRNIHKISVIGGHIPDPIAEFKDLLARYNVAEDILKNIENSGYTSPTPIQMQAIPNLLEKRQTLACAPTGSGKTAAFLVPIIHHLEGPRKKGFRAVILCPTRELVKQTYRECSRLSEGREFRTHIISNTKQALEKYGSKSSQKFDILITTPKRLLFLLNQDPPAISLANVEWLVVDEADKLFEDGPRSFRDQLQQITKACTNENLCRAMFSATNTPVVTKWCRKNLKQLVNVTIGQRNAATELVEQELLFVGSERGKLIALRNITSKGMTPPVLVFVQTKERAEELFNELIYDGINVDVIHADRTQTQRDNVIRCFREGKIWLLICTELMSRGIDFKGVNLVINYDFPPSAISYIHRIGRTGRAGHRGRAITFFAEQDIVNLRSIAAIMRASGCEVPEYMLAMKKHNKREKRKLEKSAPQRESISTMIKSKKIIKKDSEKPKKTDKKTSKNKLSSGKKMKK